MAKQLLGKEVNEKLNARIIAQCEELKAKGINPTLGIVRCGERPDDLSYEKGATKRAEALGVAVEKFVLPEDVSKEELIAELGAAFLVNHAGLETNSSFRNSAGYIQSWLKALKDDKRLYLCKYSKLFMPF